tara:strand:- start:411 stop:608 length:198 start_codon:yes stop_codon:yes gene_type:complete
MTKHEKACVLYCRMNSFTKNKVAIIEQFLKGATAADIVRNRSTNLAISTIYATYNQVKKFIQEAK